MHFAVLPTPVSFEALAGSQVARGFPLGPIWHESRCQKLESLRYLTVKAI